MQTNANHFSIEATELHAMTSQTVWTNLSCSGFHFTQLKVVDPDEETLVQCP